MPAALNEKEKAEILDRLFVVFRDRGYEGSSLADLSQATGLGKSSLYHHFPRGKEQMAEAVLEQGKAFIQTAVADVARSGEPLKIQIENVNVSAAKPMPTSCTLGTLCGPSSRTQCKARNTRATPNEPPANASNMLSVSNWRTIRGRVAPSAVRTAISFWLATPRESCRLARFTHAISRTKPTAPNNRYKVRRMSEYPLGPESARGIANDQNWTARIQ